MRIHQVVQLISLLETRIGFDRVLGFLNVTAFGSDQNDAVSTSAAVDSRRCRIFEHLNGLHIVHVDETQTVAHRVTVHNDQRLIAGRERSHTTHTHLRRGTCLGRDVIDRHTGYLALQRLIQTRHGLVA